MSDTDITSSKIFSVWKVIIPILIGLVVVGWLFWNDAKDENIPEIIHSLNFDSRALTGLAFILIAVFMREFGLTWRFRLLTNNELSWSAALHVDMLCEFSSCVTPSAVGGSALGMIFLNSKGIEFGRATTLMLVTIFLDELFFVIFCPIIVLLSIHSPLFALGNVGFSHGLQWTFWSVYLFLLLYTALLYAGIIWRPLWIQKMIYRIFSWKWLRRWSERANQLGANMVETSVSIRQHSGSFWIKAFAATSISWTGRFLVVNAIFFALMNSADSSQWLIFAREFLIWVLLMVSPTPGGSGLSEWIFTTYYGDIVTVGGMVLIMAVIWRIFTYYIYLLSGAIFVPAWLKSYFKKSSSIGSVSKSGDLPSADN
ncbi:MAG: flippase-like domain-containing protein [Muribaculaceae bacterium]|nr:flippase-like domain-containing protein [Muribaculaceae bacterium]